MASLGAARALLRRDVNGTTLGAALDRVLADPAYAERAARASTAVRAEDDALACGLWRHNA